MPSLTPRLAELIASDNAILFVGAGLRDDPNHLPTVRQIADSLAERIDYRRADRSLSAVARDFEVLKGRNALIAALREELRKHHAQPGPLHQLIADAVLPHSKILTTRFDQVLERAFDQFRKPYVLIVRDADVPFFDESKIALIKMQGDIDQPDSLIITEDDLDAFISRLPTVSDVVRAFFATKTLIFLGYDLADPQFKRFFRQVTRNLSAFRRKAYAVIPAALDPVEERYWESQNVETIVQPALTFLESLAAEVRAQVAIDRDPEPTDRLLARSKETLPERPYKALQSYTLEDAAIFTGRGEESHRLANRVLGHRLTLLYGESGSGKTSLMRAGVTPLLLKQRALVATCTPDPGQPLTELLRQTLLQTGGQAGLSAESESLLVTLRDWQARLSGPIVLVIDQFEQFFLVYGPQERQSAARLFHELHADRSLNIRLVLILREDFLGRLQTLEQHVPGLMNVRFRLEKLGRENARAAIEEPARLFDLTWEPALVQTLLDDLYDPETGISPPQLQIVCDRLYTDALENGNRPDRAPALTLERFRQLGGTATILGDYLDQSVAALPERDRAPARRLLAALVSSAGVKQRLPLPELARAADLDPGEAAPLLDHLTRLRLLQRYETVPPDNQSPITNHQLPISYELTHDYLVPRIIRWLDQDFWDAQKAREILRQDLPAWETRQRLLARDDLDLLHRQRDRLRPTTAQLAMIFAAAVFHNAHPERWGEGLPPAERLRVLVQLLKHPLPQARANAALALGAYPEAPVAMALARAAVEDPHPEVQQAAAAGIGALIENAPRPVARSAVDALLQAAGSPETQAAARRALAAVREAHPELDPYLPPDMRRKLLRRVRGSRWQRNRHRILARTFQGVQGGFWGLGLGMGLFLGAASSLRPTGSLDIRVLLVLLFAGVSLAGVIGAFSVGSAAFVDALQQFLGDGQKPLQRWALTSLTAALALGLGFSLLAAGAAGNTQPAARVMTGGVLIGLGLAAPATAPWRAARALRLGAGALIGAAVFLLAGALGFFVIDSPVWLLLMGAASGIGFFMALSQKQ